MNNKMLIDASHPEETRVVVTQGNRIEEFDFESLHKKQLRGNIYLAKVMRVEPSLQAAFVDYGGNRHGFLAFSEIHPDYYQIPVADRQALLEEEEREQREEEDETPPAAESDPKRRRPRRSRKKSDESKSAASETPDETDSEASAQAGQPDPAPTDDNAASQDGNTLSPQAPDAADPEAGDEDAPKNIDAKIDMDEISEDVALLPDDQNEADDSKEAVESVGAEDALEELPTRTSKSRRQYRIQEVIKRRQILLVQVVKEERGNKGAALTTYLSLAGRYSVLMPNTARGGGISRKITNAADRKRLKSIAQELEVPKGMGTILRTAGANRTKPEIKRDFEYLMRLWDNVRNLTLTSSAPCLVYEEGSLIKRSIRDLYNKDIDGITVAGEEGYREAKDFMRMLMPSQAKLVQPYRETTPIFAKSGIEGQLDKMLQPNVTLKSGGYLILNQTEALVAIDVNSGRSTKEHSIEETALQTNLEAADEVARQLRLRDLAGLIVIDFIDMDDRRNNRAVEKRIKDCLKSDRARIQVGQISPFGLLEMSRQRIRASVLESTTQTCETCGGVGYVRSPSSVALHVLRSIEEYVIDDARFNLVVRTPTETALYVLNQKRQSIIDLESRFGVSIVIMADDSVGSKYLVIDKDGQADGPTADAQASANGAISSDDDDEDDVIATDNIATDSVESETQSDQDGDRPKRRRRRRRRDQNEDGERQNAQSVTQTAQTDAQSREENGSNEGDSTQQGSADDDDKPRRKRRRGRRGGRRNREGNEENGQVADGAVQDGDDVATAPAKTDHQEPAQESEASPGVAENKPARPRRRRNAGADKTDKVGAMELSSEPATVSQDAADDRPASEAVPASPEPEKETRKPSSARRSRQTKPSEAVVTSADSEKSDSEPKRGWWQKRNFF